MVVKEGADHLVDAVGRDVFRQREGIGQRDGARIGEIVSGLLGR